MVPRGPKIQSLPSFIMLRGLHKNTEFCRKCQARRLGACFHAKSEACLDSRLLGTGSANWSPSGEKRQDNDAAYSTDPNAIQRFERDFESLWDRSDNIVIQ